MYEIRTHDVSLIAIVHGKLQQYALNIVLLWNVQLLPQQSYVLQHAVTDVQTLQDPSYDGTFIWRVNELIRRRRDAILGNIISLYSAPFFTSRHGGLLDDGSCVLPMYGQLDSSHLASVCAVPLIAGLL